MPKWSASAAFLKDTTIPRGEGEMILCEGGDVVILKLLLHYLFTIINHSLLGQVTRGKYGYRYKKKNVLDERGREAEGRGLIGCVIQNLLMYSIKSS